MSEKQYSKKREATRQKIERAFIREYINKNIGEISVTEICSRANINRTTFYTYFKDVYDIEESLEDRIIIELTERLVTSSMRMNNFQDQLLSEVLKFNRDSNYLPFLLIWKSNNNFVGKVTDAAVKILTDGVNTSEAAINTIKTTLTYHLAGSSSLLGDSKVAFIECLDGCGDEMSELLEKNLSCLWPIVRNGIMPVINGAMSLNGN